MSEYQKTNDEIGDAIDALNAEADRLPEFSAFGDDNSEDIAELRAWADDLSGVLDGIPPETDEVEDWLNGEWSPISDSL